MQSVFPVRKNEDKVIDSYGRKLIDLCKTTDHVTVNGRLCNDQKRKLYLLFHTRSKRHRLFVET